ncbi:MAG: hypothetical protein RLZZ602_1242 [Pseudomonadota bacterium]
MATLPLPAPAGVLDPVAMRVIPKTLGGLLVSSKDARPTHRFSA